MASPLICTCKYDEVDTLGYGTGVNCPVGVEHGNHVVGSSVGSPGDRSVHLPPVFTVEAVVEIRVHASFALIVELSQFITMQGLRLPKHKHDIRPTMYTGCFSNDNARQIYAWLKAAGVSQS